VVSLIYRPLLLAASASAMAASCIFLNSSSTGETSWRRQIDQRMK
jgi:hypothetical protein